jgi:hypothetical protein
MSVKGNQSLKTAKIRAVYLTLNTLLGLNELKYSLSTADMYFFMKLAQNECLLAHNQPRQSKLCFCINSITLQLPIH